MSNFSLQPIVFCQVFTWIALGDVDLRSSLTLLRIAYATEEETTWATCLHHCHQSIHVTDGGTVTSLSANLLQKCGHRSSTPNRIQLSCKFENCSKFSRCIKVKSHKQKLCKTRPISLQGITLSTTNYMTHVNHVKPVPVRSYHAWFLTPGSKSPKVSWKSEVKNSVNKTLGRIEKHY